MDENAQPFALDDERRVKVLSPGMLVFKRFVRNRLAITGAMILLFDVPVQLSWAAAVSPYSQSQVFKDLRPHE